jgi:serine phosphatase RsbU (regulator of sigma subunit)
VKRGVMGSRQRVLFVLTMAAAVVVTGITGVILVREYTKAHTMTGMGDIWSLLALSDQSRFALFTEIDPDDFPEPPVPVPGDYLIEIDGLPATQSNYFSIFSPQTPPGEEITVKFAHESVVYTTRVVTSAIPEGIRLQIWSAFILRTLIVAGLLLTGVYGLARKPESASVRALTLFCLALAIEMSLAMGSVADAYATFSLPGWLVPLCICLSLTSAFFWIKLHLLFPSRNAAYMHRRVLCNVILLLPVAVLGFLVLRQPQDAELVLPITIYRTLYMGLGFALLVRNNRRSEDFIEKRQTRLVLWGSAPGVLVYVAFTWMIIYVDFTMGVSYQLTRLITNIIFVLLLLIPVSFIYAFGKYKLLEVEAKLKRGTRFVVVNLLVLLAFFGFLYVFGELVLTRMGVSSRTPTLVLGILLALLFMPTQKKIRTKIEERIYPERVRLRELLRDFLASSMVRAEGSEFWKELEQKLAAGLSAERVYPVLRLEDQGIFAVGLVEPTPFSVRDEIVARMGDGDNPLLLDEVIASGRIVLSDEQKRWFLQRNCAVLLPLVTKSGLIGFLVISCKTNGEDFTAEELELLGNFSSQTALVAENLELLEDKIEKKKLEEQLRVARDIQVGLLPHEIPDVPGLEIHGLIRFCLDVAGDYYDIIRLRDGRVVLAVGDVAGKGVGPALLMANLQASLRTTQEVGVSLAESAEKINRLVFENTPSELFITFFMASVDPETGKMDYVNAGHNPPMLIRTDGRVTRLSTGGMLFGVSPDAVFGHGELDLHPGDTLLMYTDGVSEAMSPSEEEFGDDRIAEIAVENRSLPLPTLLSTIEHSVEEFHGSATYSDDFTLLAVRRNRD